MRTRIHLPMLALTLLAAAGCGASAAPVSSSAPWWRGGVDCHVHVAPDAQDGTAVLVMLDDAGLERACLLSPGYQPVCEAAPCQDQRAETMAQNDWTLEEAARSDRLVPFCGIPIGHAWSAHEMRRCAGRGARGFKMHPVSQGLSLTDEAVRESLDALLEVAASLGTPVLIHVAFEPAQIGALYQLARAHPAATIIAAHQLGPQVSMLLEAPSNVLTDLSGLSMITVEQAESLLPIWRQLGFERILFGSDWPNLEAAAHLAMLDELPLTDVERALVIRGAFARLTAPRDGGTATRIER